jgi:ATP-binding cassette subfamily F protein 3
VSHDRELLRALTTKLWILHDRHVTEFSGGFAEWEEVSAERAHAASVRAAEESSLRRVHERQKLARKKEEAPPSAKDQRRKERIAQRELEQVEARITELEDGIARVTRQLEDPELYNREGGVEKAAGLGRDLERLKSALDQELARWASLSESSGVST